VPLGGAALLTTRHPSSVARQHESERASNLWNAPAIPAARRDEDLVARSQLVWARI